MASIWLGTAKIDITPDFPVPLAGFADRQKLGPAEGISQRLFARVFLFTSEGRKQVSSLFISADLIWWGSDRIPSLKQRIKEQFGIHEEHIILHATHTHSGPQTSELFTTPLGQCVISYVEKLEAALLKGIAEARRNLEAVHIQAGLGECRIGINRRIRKQEQMELAPNEHGIVDPEVNVLLFRRLEGSIKALFVHYTCHPVITRENLVSSEFCGVAMGLVEQALGDDVVSAYLQGCCGDINPGRNGAFSFGSDERVRQLGGELAEETLAVIHRPMAAVASSSITARSMTTMLPLKALPDKARLTALSAREDVLGEWSRLLLAQPERLTASVPLEMTYWKMGEELSLLTMNCEAVVNYGLFIKRQFKGKVLPLGYSNGMFGYLPTAQQIEEGGYEPYDSSFYFAMPSTLEDGVEQQVYRSIIQLVSEGN